MQQEVKQTWFFKHTPQEVWEYLTKPELMEQWLMKTDFQPKVGHKFRFTHVPKNESIYKGITDCEVLEIVPISKLSYSWQGYTQDGRRTFTSVVVWTLIVKENGTELQLEHTGFTLIEDVQNHDKGWNVCLKRFENSIDTIQ